MAGPETQCPLVLLLCQYTWLLVPLFHFQLCSNYLVSVKWSCSDYIQLWLLTHYGFLRPPLWIALFSDANSIDSNCFSCSTLRSLPSQLSTPTHLHHRKLSNCGAHLLKFPFSGKFQFCAAQKQLLNISYPVFIAVTNLEGLVKLFNHRQKQKYPLPQIFWNGTKKIWSAGSLG